MTLVELLVVVTIMVLLLGIMIPMMQSATEGRKVREGARQFSTFLSRAQTTAQTKGRPMAVAFEGDPANPNRVWKLWLLETPPPYAGDTLDSRVVIRSSGGYYTASFSKASNFRAMPPFVTPGDGIRFGYSGPIYELVGWGQPPAPRIQGDQIIWRLGVREPRHGLDQMPAPTSPEGVPFEIHRVPRSPEKHAVEFLTLPKGIIVDLGWSGIDKQVGGDGRGWWQVGGQPIAPLPKHAFGIGHFIIFGPDGSVTERGFHRSNRRMATKGTSLERFVFHHLDFYYLIGQDDQAGLGKEGDRNNLEDTGNIWVVVSPKGKTVTARNAGVPDEFLHKRDEQPLSVAVEHARRFARQEIYVGGG